MHDTANGSRSKMDKVAARLACLAGIVGQPDGSYRCDCPRLCGRGHGGSVTVRVGADSAIAAVCEKCGSERVSTWLELETRLLGGGMDDAERQRWLVYAREEIERTRKSSKWLRKLADDEDESAAKLKRLIEQSETNVELKGESNA